MLYRSTTQPQAKANTFMSASRSFSRVRSQAPRSRAHFCCDAQCVCPEVSVQSAAHGMPGPPVIYQGKRYSYPAGRRDCERRFRKEGDWEDGGRYPREVLARAAAPSYPALEGSGALYSPGRHIFASFPGWRVNLHLLRSQSANLPPPECSPAATGRTRARLRLASTAHTWVRSAVAIASATPWALPRASRKYPWKASDAQRPHRLTTAESRYADHKAEAPPKRRL
jgi:hypothetical protein